MIKKNNDRIEIKTNTGGKAGDVVKPQKSKGKLASATVQIVNDPTQNAYVFTRDVDRMEIPKNYKKLVEVCRFFYMHDPIAGTIVNKMVDMCVSDLKNMKSDCTDDEIEVDDQEDDDFDEYNPEQAFIDALESFEF